VSAFRFTRFASLALAASLGAAAGAQSAPVEADAPPTTARVVIAHDAEATDAFVPRPEKVRGMVSRAILQLTGKPDAKSAWQSLVSAKDVVGIKVFSAPGADAGTRPAVVAAVIEGLLEAKLPPGNIVIWDRQRADLRAAGFVELAARYGVRVEGSANAGYDENAAYSPERPILGQLVWGDTEFGRKGDGVGRRSFVTRLLTREITRIISIAPLLNHNTTGVNGHLYSLALGSVDNFIRFENELSLLSTAVPEIFALPSISDRVALNITDALICQYEGEQRGLLHYSAALNELRFSKDPVALDLLSLRELERTRLASKIPIPRHHSITNQMDLLQNAALLELGVADEANIKVERARSGK